MYEQTKNFNVFYFSLWTLLSLPVSSFTTAGVIYCIPLKIPSKWYIRGLIVHRSHLRKIWHFPRAVKGLKFQRSYTGQLHFPNLPDAQDNKQHDVKRLNHGSLMLIIFYLYRKIWLFWEVNGKLVLGENFSLAWYQLTVKPGTGVTFSRNASWFLR